MAAICKQCGAPLEAGNKFCMTCGAPAEAAMEQPQVQQSQAYQASQPQQAYQAQQSYQAPPAGKQKRQKKQKAVYIDPNAPGPGSPYEPITTKGYIGIALLMAIPVVGIILAIVWALGGCRKVNKRNFARAMLIMMIIALILSLVIGGIGGLLVKKAAKEAGITGEEASGLVSGITGLLGIGDGKDGGSEGAGGSGTSTGNEELDALADLLGGLEALTGEESGIDELLGEVSSINEEASENADGWPKELPDYPDGTMKAVETYRTEISGTSRETMMEYIDTLKKKGFEYEDFYNFGMTEEDMLGMDGWWATDGKLYLSFSYYDGTVTIDHMTELPDLSSLLG